MMSAAASLGALRLWEIDESLNVIDKFLYASDEYIKSGALIAFGLVTSNIRHECDPAWALLSEHLEYLECNSFFFRFMW